MHLFTCPPFYRPDKASTVAVVLDASSDELERSEAVVVARANPSDIGFGNASTAACNLWPLY